MTPHELETTRDGALHRELFAACAVFGWTRSETEVQHERDWDCSWMECGWCKDGAHVISDNRMTLALAEELIRMAGLVRPKGN